MSADKRWGQDSENPVCGFWICAMYGEVPNNDSGPYGITSLENGRAGVQPRPANRRGPRTEADFIVILLWHTVNERTCAAGSAQPALAQEKADTPGNRRDVCLFFMEKSAWRTVQSGRVSMRVQTRSSRLSLWLTTSNPRLRCSASRTRKFQICAWVTRSSMAEISSHRRNRVAG